MSNLDYWKKLKEVPDSAKKPIKGGRISGMTSINPVWRIKRLTEEFGPCGIGWKVEIKDKWIESGGNDEKSAFVDIDLFIKVDGEWSEPIPGTGGSSFVANESRGLYMSDECFKMAYTDAISVAAKTLGLAADVYWDKDDSNKYDNKRLGITEHNIYAIKRRVEEKMTTLIKKVGSSSDLSKEIGLSEKQTANLMKYFDTIAKFERKLDEIDKKH